VTRNLYRGVTYWRAVRIPLAVVVVTIGQWVVRYVVL
jgi:hypothetical protein